MNIEPERPDIHFDVVLTDLVVGVDGIYSPIGRYHVGIFSHKGSLLSDGDRRVFVNSGIYYLFERSNNGLHTVQVATIDCLACHKRSTEAGLNNDCLSLTGRTLEVENLSSTFRALN